MLSTEWQKSGYSLANGNCLEARWTAGSHCDSGACLEARWQKSSHSNGHSMCLEARQDGTVQVRDSKDTGGPVLSVSPSAWADFLTRLKA